MARSEPAIERTIFHGFAAFIMSVALLFAAPAAAQTFPQLTGRVVDDAHLLTPAEIADLTQKSQALEAQSGRQLVVATVPSLQGYPIEDYGYRLGRAWGIGQKGKDNGVILLVAPNEHKVRIEMSIIIWTAAQPRISSSRRSPITIFFCHSSPFAEGRMVACW